MKIAFFGTWEFSKNILDWILKYNEIEVSLVVSQPDKPIWRKKVITPTPVKICAEHYNIPVLQPEKLRNNEAFFETLRNRELDFIVVVAYWKIVPNEVLEAPRHACINIHWSILPAYRWASPIQESIKNWDIETWLTIMYMSEGMDEWDILKIEKVQIDILDKTQNIFDKFEKIWAPLLINTLEWILDWSIKWEKQNDSKATYCSKIIKEDGEIDFNDSAKSIYDTYRAYNTWPWIFSSYKWKKILIEECILEEHEFTHDETFQIWAVVEIEKNEKTNIWILCNPGILILKKIKLEWKKSMDINSFINGNKEFLDYKFETCST